MKIAFFSPHSAIWQYSFLESLVGDTLKRSGHEILFVRCEEFLKPYCLSMYALGQDADASLEMKQRACNLCKKTRDALKGSFGYRQILMNELFTSAMQAEVDALLQTVDKTNVLRFEYKGISVGRLSLYEYLLKLKKLDAVLTDDEWRVGKVQLRNALNIFLLTEKFLDAEKPDKVFVYNSHYSAHSIFAEVAASRGIEVFFMHAGDCMGKFHKTVMLGRDSPAKHQQYLLKTWPNHRDKRSCHDLSILVDHFTQLLKSRLSMTYSSALGSTGTFDVHKHFGISQSQKIAVATLSSLDERVTEELVGITPVFDNLVFKDQIEWVEFLIEHFSKRPDLFLIIRVHPREFPNKRDNVYSHHAKILKEKLQNLPANVKVNWPSDGISIYALMQETDIFLNAWSTAGKEMGFYGIPVLIYEKRYPLYAPDINLVASSKEDYVRKLDEGLNSGWSLEWSKKACRWFSVEYIDDLFDLSDGVRFSEHDYQNRRLLNLAFRAMAKINPINIRRFELMVRSRKLKETRNIERLVIESKQSRVDLDVTDRCESDAAEAKAIKSCLNAVAKEMYLNYNVETKLRKNLRAAGLEI